MNTTFSRRHFLKGSSMAVLGAAASKFSTGAAASEKLKAVIIGHTGRGDYGHGLESIFSNRPNIEVVALADPDIEGRARAVAKLGSVRPYADYREMLTKERPQLVSLAMRHSDQHHDIALACLRAGAHIYSEKPFTATPAEADALLAEAQKRTLKIAVAHTMRMVPSIVRLKQAIGEGLIGDLVELRAFGKQDARAGGEDMMVLGSHLFDLMRLYLGDPLWCNARVSEKGRDITRTDGRLVKDNVGLLAGDEVFAQFAFSKGVNATFTSAGKLRETIGHWGIEFFGSKGVARINCDIAPNVFVRKSDPWKPEGRAEQWQPFDAGLTKTPSAHNLGPVGDWLDAIAQNREPECSGRNGAWAVEMVMGIYQAALAGKRVSFPLASRGHPLAAK
jgi:predicted dehydrogenase